MFKRINTCDGIHNSLDVRFTKACDNDCSFCIDKTGLDALGKIDVDKMIKSTIESGIKDVLILGGEPFLNPKKLLQYVEGIREFADYIYITTSLPHTFVTSYTTCMQILNKIDGFNVSINGNTSDTNNKILRASNNYNRLEMVNKLNSLYRNKMRINLNLVKGGIDTKMKLMSILCDLEYIGCKEVKITELQSSDLYVSYESIMGIRMKSPYSSGCQNEIDISGIYDMTILLKRSCFVVENTLKATFSDLIKSTIKLFMKPNNQFAVVYENGETKKGWVKNDNSIN